MSNFKPMLKTTQVFQDMSQICPVSEKTQVKFDVGQNRHMSKKTHINFDTCKNLPEFYSTQVFKDLRLKRLTSLRTQYSIKSLNDRLANRQRSNPISGSIQLVNMIYTLIGGYRFILYKLSRISRVFLNRVKTIKSNR